MNAPKPQVTRTTFLSMQVCIPSNWSDNDVMQFANTENPAGTEHGWIIRKQGDPALSGDPERAKCNERAGFVHIVLDC